MTVLFAVLVPVVTYTLVGRWYANRCLPAIIRESRQAYRYEHIAMSAARFEHAYHFAFWPVFMLIRATKGMRDRRWDRAKAAVDAANGDHA